MLEGRKRWLRLEDLRERRATSRRERGERWEGTKERWERRERKRENILL